jgi:BirA family transcriptional regulator, biotin operon repressor / biotin---[acetyl-CoA-carboxylase] ligase
MIDAQLKLEQLASIDSTNAELLRRLQAGVRAPMAIYALAQTAGRGRNGKSWDAPLFGLYYSQTLSLACAPSELAGLSLALGVAAVEAIHAASLPAHALAIRLKWPNDLWINGKKLGGILIEIAPSGPNQIANSTTVVAGIGINLAGTSDAMRTDLAAHGVELAASALAARMLACWQQAAAQFSRAGFADFHSRWNALDALTGKAVSLSDSPEQIWQASGVTDTGALKLHCAQQGERLVASGEVSLSTRLVGS